MLIQLQKTWSDAKVGDAISAETRGFIHDASVAATTATGNETEQAGTAVTVFVDETGTLLGETFTTGTADNYDPASRSCVGGD